MTCVVALKQNNKVYMGCDSISVSGDTYTLTGDVKVFKKDKMIFGCAGSVRARQILQYNFKIPKQKTKNDHEYMCTDFISELQNTFKDTHFGTQKSIEGSNFIVGYNNNIYVIYSDYQVNINSHDYVSIGSGTDFSNGSLCTTKNMNILPEEKIRLALKAAEAHCTTVHGPFVIIEGI